MRESFIIDGVKHITLDIELSETRQIQVSESTILWLKNELGSDHTCIIYCHYPITEKKDNISYYHTHNPEKAFLVNSRKLRKIIQGTNCRLWISGHSHFYYEVELDNTKHITLPSFAEDNHGRPNGSYAVLDTENLSLDIKHII